LLNLAAALIQERFPSREEKHISRLRKFGIAIRNVGIVLDSINFYEFFQKLRDDLKIMRIYF